MITVQVNDAQGRIVPTAGNEITFALQGPGKIIGVGNGDPSSHEPDRYIDTVSSLPITAWRMLTVENAENRPEVIADFDDSDWLAAFARREGGRRGAGGEAVQTGKAIVYRGIFELPESKSQTVLSLILRSLGQRAVGLHQWKTDRPERRAAITPGMNSRWTRRCFIPEKTSSRW